MNKQYYEADVLAEHLARRYPQGGLSAKATEIGMQALAEAYTTYTEVDRLSDLDRLIEPGELHRRDLARQRTRRRRADEPGPDLSRHGPVRQGDRGLERGPAQVA